MAEQNFIPALRFHWLTNAYDKLVGLTMPEKEFKNNLLAEAHIHTGDKVLDFGVGTGTLSLMAYAQQPNAIYFGVDVDSHILKIAGEKIKEAKAQITLQLYDGAALPFADNSFDRVLSSLVFHHLSRKQKANALKEIYRVLKPGGELHIADWGKAANGMMRTLFYLVQLLDGFENTSDNVDGKLPTIICFAGFNDIVVKQKINTVYGTLELLKAIK